LKYYPKQAISIYTLINIAANETVSQCLCGEPKPRAKRAGECNERSNLISIRIYLDCHVHCRELAMTNEDCDTVWACLGRRRLPQRICRERFETVPYMSSPCRLDIIFDLEMG